ncbi:MAG TPA: MltA domain-containing protein [Pseudomonadota bacterium]|nr:MltA domain-containing protein [Pseudomonadota bacterium]
MRQLLLVALLCGCAKAEAHECVDATVEKPPAHDQLKLTKAKWSELPGWAEDKHHEAVSAFTVSCAKLAELKDDDLVGADGHGGKARQWRGACDRASKLKPGDDKAAREFFESEFTPWQAAGKSGPVGKLTGYFVQELHASRKKGGKYTVPILGRPADLVMVDLSQFIPDAHGRRIWGRHDDKGNIVPYFKRSDLRKGALAQQKLEIMYADDPVDVLFAQIEGSAKAVMDDGTTVWLGFDGKNGHKYRGVGGVLKEKGVLTGAYNGTMAGIRKWFADNPTQFDEIADQNPSFVFFKESKLPGAVGSQDVILTPRRSMAIDRAFIAHGTPIWVDTRAPLGGAPGTAAWQHLLVAQDTGSGILGAVRGDIYWGDDASAAALGGRMGGEGRYWLLLPSGVTQ